MIKQLILTSPTASGLNSKIKQHESEGFECVGSHQVVTIISQCSYSGNQLSRTINEVEYSQTMKLIED